MRRTLRPESAAGGVLLRATTLSTLEAPRSARRVSDSSMAQTRATVQDLDDPAVTAMLLDIEAASAANRIVDDSAHFWDAREEARQSRLRQRQGSIEIFDKETLEKLAQRPAPTDKCDEE